ncbi:MAG: peptidyl-prolyl cis-trans isomerase [bacterium]|nr:peptidyl-prolyl cis-trans isomerase [bacterium]
MNKKGLIAFLLTLSLFGCAKKKEPVEKVLVSVGNSKLTVEMVTRDVPEYLQPMISREQIKNHIQQWIEKELIYQAATKIGLDLEPDYRYELEKAKKDILVRKYLDQYLLSAENDITDEEALKYYEDHRQDFVVSETEMHALHILVTNQADAEKARKKILSGADFEEVAREYSIDYADKKRIELDFFTKTDVVPEIARRLFSYESGVITPPIRSLFGYHIFKILEVRKPGSYKKYEDVQHKIKNRIRSGKQKQQYRDLIGELRQKIIVKKDDKFLQEIFTDTTMLKIQKK